MSRAKFYASPASPLYAGSPFVQSRFAPVMPGGRMDTLAFTATLTRPMIPPQRCHCGNVTTVGLSPAGKGCCLLCRCDEHTPDTHGKGTRIAKNGYREPDTHSEPRPGCGPYCTRPALSGSLLTEPFPTFEEWQKTHGSQHLRDKYGIVSHVGGHVVYNARGRLSAHIPDIRNCGCDICREEHN